MAADNLITVSMPPVQWSTGSAPRDAENESLTPKPKKSSPNAKAADRENASADLQFEPSFPHEVDSFA